MKTALIDWKELLARIAPMEQSLSELKYQQHQTQLGQQQSLSELRRRSTEAATALFSLQKSTLNQTELLQDLNEQTRELTRQAEQTRLEPSMLQALRKSLDGLQQVNDSNGKLLMSLQQELKSLREQQMAGEELTRETLRQTGETYRKLADRKPVQGKPEAKTPTWLWLMLGGSLILNCVLMGWLSLHKLVIIPQSDLQARAATTHQR